MAEMVFFSGKSLQQALLAAARHFHLEVEEVAYRQREQRQGLVRGRERVVVEVDAAAPRREPKSAPPPASAPVAPRASVSRERSAGREPSRPIRADGPERRPEPPRRPAELVAASGPESEAVQMALDHLSRLASIGVEADVWMGEENLWIDLRAKSSEAVGAQQAEWIEAVAHLLPRATRGLFGAGVAMRVDSGGARERLLEELRVAAVAAADRVRQSGQPETLGEMNPADRRIVHMALAEDPDVATESLGTGVLKRIRIRPR